MPTPDPESAPSSAGVPRTARDIRDSDIVRPARAIGDFRLGLLPGPVPEVRTRWRRIRWVPVPHRRPTRRLGADPSRRVAAVREVAGILRFGAVPAGAGTHGSSTLRWIVSIPTIRRRYAR